MGDCNKEIKQLIDERMEKGMKQYGHGLKQDSGYDWVQEALEESLDLAIYISAKLVEVKKQQPNTVKVYSKKGCEYCVYAKEFLEENNIEYEEIDMTDKDTTDLKTRTKQNTFPFIFRGYTFLGGYKELLEEYKF